MKAASLRARQSRSTAAATRKALVVNRVNAISAGRRLVSSDSNRRLTLLILVMAFATAVVVTTEFVAVGLLPAMARDLHLAVGDAGIFVTGFALAAAVLGPLLTIAAGYLQPRHALAGALAVFALGNLAIA